jgi:signal transduction histidine kinase
MIKTKILHLLITGVLTAGCMTAGIQYYLRHRTVIVPEFWMRQVMLLIVISGILAGAVPWIKKRGMVFLAIAVQFGIMLLICYPEGEYLGQETTLIFLLILQSILFLPLSWGILCSLLMTIVALLVRPAGVVWDLQPVPAAFESRFSFGYYSFFVMVITGMLRYAIDISRRQCGMIDRLDKTVDQLTSANMEFQEYAAIAGIESIIKERKRISRDIHDTIGYSLMNMIMMMEAATDLVPEEAEKLKSILEQTRDQAQKGLQETRRALRALRSVEEENLSGLKAIQKLISVFERVTGVVVQKEYGNLPFYISDEINIFLYRMVQEGLTNAFRHGKATTIMIHFWIHDDNTLILRIRDNGSGAGGDIKEGIGLAGMRERIEKIQGSLEARDVFDGFEIIARIPLQDYPESSGKGRKEP